MRARTIAAAGILVAVFVIGALLPGAGNVERARPAPTITAPGSRWTTTRAVAAPQDTVRSPFTIAFGAGGGRLLAWSRELDAGTLTRIVTGDGRLLTLHDSELIEGPVAVGDDRYAMVLQSGRPRSGVYDVEVLLLRSDGTTDERSTVATGADGTYVEALAISPRGDVAVAFTVCDPQRVECDGVPLRVALRRAGGRFERPLTLAPGFRYGEYGGDTAQLAFNARGDLALTYTRDFGLWARLRPAGARAFGRARAVAPLTGGFTWLQATLAGDRRLTVLLGEKSEGATFSRPGIVRVSRSAPDMARFGAPQILDRRAAHAVVELRSAGDGSAVATWGHRYAIAGPVGRFGRPRAIGGAGNSSLAVGRDGRALIAFTRGDQVRLFARVRAPRGRAFGRPEPVPGGLDAFAANAAIDPRTERPVIVWYRGNSTRHEISTAVRR